LHAAHRVVANALRHLDATGGSMVAPVKRAA
jgi:hypothetical protein